MTVTSNDTAGGEDQKKDKESFLTNRLLILLFWTVHMSLFALMKYRFITKEKLINSKVVLVCVKQISLLKNSFFFEGKDSANNFRCY